MRNALVRKINTGYQVTLPPEFRKCNHLSVGSMVSVTNQGNKLIIEPFKNKSEALKKLESLFKNAPTEFESMPDQEVSDFVRHEIKAARSKKNYNK